MGGNVGGVTSFAGSGASSWSDGLATTASFNAPLGLSVSSTGTVFVADIVNNRVRMITTSGLHFKNLNIYSF